MIKKLIPFCAVVALFACHNVDTESTGETIAVQELTSNVDNVSYNKGVSAMYGGVSSGDIIIAGGCNFPDTPVADGGKKVYYDNVYRATFQDDGTINWEQVDTLRTPAAYGVSVTTDNGILQVGGNNSDGGIDNTWLMNPDDDTNRLMEYPKLPAKIDNMAGALLGNRVYIVGGNNNGTPSNKVYSLDLDDIETGWVEEMPFPGSPRVQPVCAAANGKLYIWGGFSTSTDDNPATLSVSGYSYAPETKTWTPVATPVDREGNEVSLGGGVAYAMGDTAILCAGGVNKDIFLNALQGKYDNREYLTHEPEWYKFNKLVLIYDIRNDNWTQLPCEIKGRAGAIAVEQEEKLYIIEGEEMPGIRTNTFTKIDLNEIQKSN